MPASSAIIGRILCHFGKHKVELPDDFSGELRCGRCDTLLATIPGSIPIPNHLRHDPTYVNGCHGKTRFASYAEAIARMDRMKSRPTTLHPYFCKHCDSFHLGN